MEYYILHTMIIANYLSSMVKAKLLNLNLNLNLSLK